MMSRLLPEVLAVRRRLEGNERVILDLHVPADIIHFSGHFPGLAILPGVVQIDWAVRFACRHFRLSGKFSMMENIKFQSLILPDARLELVLCKNDEKAGVEFSFTSSQRKHSTGRIVFGASP